MTMIWRRKLVKYVLLLAPLSLLFYNQLVWIPNHELLSIAVERFMASPYYDHRNRHVVNMKEDATSDRTKFGSISTQPLEWATPHFHALYRNNKSQSLLLHEQPLTQDVSQQHEQQQHFLESPSNIPFFYMYPSKVLLSSTNSQKYHMEQLFSHNLSKYPQVMPPNYRVDVGYDIDILQALWNHSHRVQNPNDAQLFLIPISFGAIRYDTELTISQKAAIFQEIWKHLQDQPPFVQGKPHVIVSMIFELFDTWQARWWKRELKQLGLLQFYQNIHQRVSIARSDDLLGTHFAYLHNVTSSNKFHDNKFDTTTMFRGFDELFREERPVTEYTFCVGLGGNAKHVPLRKPTMENFHGSTLFIFYHTRRAPSAYDSTKYRHAPLMNVSWSLLPPSSIGHEIPPAQWARDVSDSKFCLVIRGDNPASNSLFTAVKAGCIPVLISDWFLFYAPPFPTTLDLRDFSIVIAEEEFIQNPHAAIESLRHLPDEWIKSKLQALAWAQRVLLMDHPNSLFVPAFLREAMASFTRPASKVLRKG